MLSDSVVNEGNMLFILCLATTLSSFCRKKREPRILGSLRR